MSKEKDNINTNDDSKKTGDYSWLKHSGEGYLKLVKEEIDRLENLNKKKKEIESD